MVVAVVAVAQTIVPPEALVVQVAVVKAEAGVLLLPVFLALLTPVAAVVVEIPTVRLMRVQADQVW